MTTYRKQADGSFLELETGRAVSPGEADVRWRIFQGRPVFGLTPLERQAPEGAMPHPLGLCSPDGEKPLLLFFESLDRAIRWILSQDLYAMPVPVDESLFADWHAGMRLCFSDPDVVANPEDSLPVRVFSFRDAAFQAVTFVTPAQWN